MEQMGSSLNEGPLSEGIFLSEGVLEDLGISTSLAPQIPFRLWGRARGCL